MTRSLLAAFVVVSILGGCMGTPDYVAGRADNDMLRFSASNYAMPATGVR